jgi:hypothetical protein
MPRTPLQPLLLLALLLLFCVLCGASVWASQLEGGEGQALDLPQAATVELDAAASPKACWREAKSRGTGKLPDRQSKKCPNNHPDKSGGLCYESCPKSMVGVGPVCWDDCSKTKYHSKGVVFCCQDDDTCSNLVTELGFKIPKELVKFAIDIAVNPTQVLKILKDFRQLVSDVADLKVPVCKTSNSFLDVEELFDLPEGDEEGEEQPQPVLDLPDIADA